MMYVAACVFTREHPELSVKIQNYIKERYNMDIMRCCVKNYNVQKQIDLIKENYKDGWKSLAQYIEFAPNDVMVSICHNCSSIFEENEQEVERLSLWELIDSDKFFVYKDFNKEKITIQDCWRSYDNIKEQEAVRNILKKMNVEIVELEESKEKTQFCGISTLQAQPKRNADMVPIRYVANAKGKFEEHSEEEKEEAMIAHGKKITTEKVISYCHYCHIGLKKSKKEALLLAELLF